MAASASPVFTFMLVPPDNYEVMGSGLAGGTWLPVPKSRGKPLLPAQPLSQYVKDCIELLSRVQSVAIVGGTKKQFVLRVDLRARNDATRTVSFEIARSNEHVELLQSEVLEACRQHPLTSVTGLEPCALCEQLKILPPLPASTERLFSNAATIHKTVEDRLNLFVAGALVPPSDNEHYCEGQVSVPVAVRNFLLHGVDDIDVLK